MPVMPVDRRLRRELSEVIAAHMRDPANPRAFYERVVAIHEELGRAPAQEADHSATEIADEIRMLFECSKPHERFDSPETWEQYRRYLAFLRTDRALPVAPAALSGAAPSMMLSGSFPPRRLAWVLLLALLLSLAAWPWASWYLFAACWVISPLIWLVCTVEQGGETENRAWPFESDAQWREHERLLADMNLPASWATSLHYRRSLPRWWHATVFALSMGLLMLVLYCLVASIWPLLVIAMSLARYDETGDNDSSSDAAPAAR
jgi:hypothetical protein